MEKGSLGVTCTGSSLSRQLLRLLLISIFLIPLQSRAQNGGSKTEALWAAINWNKIYRASHISQADSSLFYGHYVSEKIEALRDRFFAEASSNRSDTLVTRYEDRFISLFISEYATFQSALQDWRQVFQLGSTSIPNLRLEAANGPCTNMDFSQNFTGWSGYIQARNTNPNRNGPVITGQKINGFGQHCIMTPTMTDPYIPSLSVVPPAPATQRSLRLGNVVNGGHIASVSQSFLVSPSNVLFTYRYAVVLEDPADAGGHEGLNRPYFMAILTDKNGDTIKCAEYTVVVSTSLSGSGFQQGCEPNQANLQNRMANYGCPIGASGSDGTGLYTGARPLTAPISGFCQNRTFYYKNWTTVSIPLEKYMGQNITITFTAADCTPSGHLGYAYVQAECSPISVLDPGTICTGKQTKTLQAPDGFASYSWLGPGIVGANNTQSILVNKSGTYKMILTPISDYPCPDTVTLVIKEKCPSLGIADTLCEGLKGSGQAAGVNLNSYNSQITGQINGSTVISWHKALPASVTNKVNNPADVTVGNGSKWYAVIANTGSSNDTNSIVFTILPKPNILFPEIPVSCEGGAPFLIKGVSPAGGIFSGLHVTPSGVFTPQNTGSFPIQYRVSTPQGCTDSLSKPAVVRNVLDLIATGDTLVCYGGQPLSLPLHAKTNTDSLLWESSYGTFSDPKLASPTLQVSGPFPMDKKIKVSVTALSKTCPSVSDTVDIVVAQLPTVIVPEDTLFCVNEQPITWTVKGTVHNADSIYWIAHPKIQLNTPKLPNTSATIQSSYPNKSQGTLVLTAFKQGCPPIKDSFSVSLNPPPLVDAGKDDTVCLNDLITRTAPSNPSWTYFWSLNTPKQTISQSSSVSFVASLQAQQLYLIVKDSYGCENKDSCSIYTVKPLAFSIKGEDICPGQTKSIVTTLASGQASPTGFSWLKDDLQEIPASSWKQLAYHERGKYSLVLKYKECKSTASTTVLYRPHPEIELPKNLKFCFETDPPLALKPNALPNYRWFSNGILIDTNRIIYVSPKEDTEYTLIAGNADGCNDSARILVRKVCPPRLFVPNVITPESSDVNSTLQIFGAHYTRFEITIFSRWGEVIFNTTDPKNTWNGVYKSENMPIGVYPWIVTYEGDTEEYKGPYKKVGEVTIVR